MELPLLKHLARKYRRTTIKLERGIPYLDSDDDSSSSDESSPVVQRHRNKHENRRNRSRSPSRRLKSPRREHSPDRKRSPRRDKNPDGNSGQPMDRAVKTICKPLNVSPIFTCSDGRVNIKLNITGGITPYKYKWSDGSTQSYLDGLSFGYHVSLTVTDARRCDTTVNFVTPDLSICN